jgi:hypothetical protein
MIQQIRRNRIIFLLSILTLFNSCISEADLSEFDFSEKLLIMGYVGDHNEPARVDILGSVPIDDKISSSRLINDAIVELIEITKDNDTLSYPIPFDVNRGFYHTVDSGIAKSNHIYWIEVILEDDFWKSAPSKMINNPQVIISEPVYEFDKRRERYEVDVIDNDEYFSYIIGDFGQGVNLFLAIEYYFYFDKKFRVDSKVSSSVYLYTPSEIYDPYVYVMQIPNEVNDFFREWAIQFEAADEPDFFSQMLSISPGPLSSNFVNENGQPAANVVGVFFSGFTKRYRQESN